MRDGLMTSQAMTENLGAERRRGRVPPFLLHRKPILHSKEASFLRGRDALLLDPAGQEPDAVARRTSRLAVPHWTRDIDVCPGSLHKGLGGVWRREKTPNEQTA